MPAYVVANYAVTDPEGIEPYVPAAGPILADAGGEVLVADVETDVREGDAGHVTVVVRFDSKEAAEAWYTSNEYEAIKPLRTDHSTGVLVLADGYVPASD